MRKQESAQRTLQRAIDEFKLTSLIGLFSGGADSMASNYIASQHHLWRGCIHVNTKTSPVAELASRIAIQRMDAMEWEYITASPMTTYRMLVAKYGFPGPNAHPKIYSYLKGRPIRTATTEWRKRLTAQESRRIGFVTGIRAEESTRRSKMPYAKLQEGIVWINPILDWSKPDRNEFLAESGINEHLNSSRDSYGECDCRCYVRPGEAEIKDAVLPIMPRYRAKMEELARLCREIDLLEVEAGMRAENEIIHEGFTSWGIILAALKQRLKRWKHSQFAMIAKVS